MTPGPGPVRWLLGRHAGGVGLAVAIGIAAPWLGALPVRAIPAVVSGAPPPEELTALLGAHPSLDALLGALVVAGALSFLLALVATRQAAALGARALLDLRDVALARVLARPPDWLRDQGRGAAAKNALLAQCRVVASYATGTVPAAVGVASAVVIWSQALGASVGGGAGALVVAAVVGVLLVVNLGAVWLTATRSQRAQQQVLAETTAYVTAVNESIDHLPTLQLAAATRAQRARAGAIAARMSAAEVRVATWSGLASAASSGLTLLAIPLLVVAWRALDLDGASLAVMIPSLLMLQRSVAGLGSLWTSYRVARPAIDLVGGVMSGEPDVFTPGTEPPVTGHLVFEDVTWRAGERTILDGVTLDIRPGETVAIVGAGGSGKSTLLRLAARLLSPTDGLVLLDGTDVTRLELDHLRRKVATLEQHPAVFDRTLRENLVLDDRAVAPDALARATRAAQLDEVIARLPDGLDARLAGGGALSGSERRRLALARVLLLDPDVVLIDELEAGLPQAQAEALLAATRAATAGKTCVLVTHRPDLLATDRVVFLAGGRIVDSGTHADLAARNDAYRALLSRADREGTG